MTNEPLSGMRLGIRAVPAVKYAVGLAGIAAALAAARGFLPGVSFLQMLPIIVGCIIAMTALLIFSSATGQSSIRHRTAVAAVFLWAVCIFVIVFMAITVSAVVAGKPESWANLILPKQAAASSAIEELTKVTNPNVTTTPTVSMPGAESKPIADRTPRPTASPTRRSPYQLQPYEIEQGLALTKPGSSAWEPAVLNLLLPEGIRSDVRKVTYKFPNGSSGEFERLSENSFFAIVNDQDKCVSGNIEITVELDYGISVFSSKSYCELWNSD